MVVEPLRAFDSWFVLLERPGLPMHVGGLAVLDSAARTRGPIRLVELRRRLRGRLRDLPRLRSRIGQAPLGLRRPLWLPDDNFDVGRHLEHWTLPPGSGQRELLELAGQLHGRLLPRDRPLWRVALIEGLSGGRQALLTTTHHAITDGIAGVEVTRAIFDHPDGEAAPTAATGDGFFGAGAGPGGLTRALQAVAGAARYVAGGPVAAPGPFNGGVGPRRALATADLRLDDAVAVKRRLGGSVDDVVLASVALGLGAHMERAGWRTEGMRLRALVPVSTLGGGSGLGNHVTATFLDLPVDLDPVRCLHEIAAAKTVHRAWHEPLGLSVALEAAGLAPAALAAPVTWLVSCLPVAHLIVSDVPGPPEPLSLLGAPMVGAYPLMPLTPAIGLSIAVVTIGGAMGVGITTDPELVPGGDELAGEIGRAFAALLDIAHARRRAAAPGAARR
ncbi:MAG TPA: wax ester/triacylglycerol synthase family O-acyltransferase [Candidatus Eisenbacteria bacterium]|nr:wax ester/triacylglycerol synthase family O-acyltransferase [Candidatus Eisenbacteria bacterium]